MTCKVTPGQLATRLISKYYTGPLTVGVGSNYNYAYASSDIVPDNYYWLVLEASLNIIGGGGSESASNQASLWMTNPAAQSIIPPNAPATYQQQAIFQSMKFGLPAPSAICNGGPLDPSKCIRVDDTTTLDASNFGNSTSFTARMLRDRRPLIVPPKCALIGSNWLVFGTGGGIDTQIILNILYAQMKLTETFDAW